jgi:hypothetical protein
MEAPFPEPNPDDPDHPGNWATDEPPFRGTSAARRKMNDWHGEMSQPALINAIANRLEQVTRWDDTPPFVKDPLWDEEWTLDDRLEAIGRWLRRHGGDQAEEAVPAPPYFVPYVRDGGLQGRYNALEAIILFLTSDKRWSQEVWPSLANLPMHALERDKEEVQIAGHAGGLPDFSRLRL